MTLDDLLFAINALSCIVICWTALSYFFVRGEPHDLQGLMLQLGLIFVIASTAATPLALLQTGELPSWWAVMQRVGVAILAGCFYNWRFGVKRQLSQLLTGCANRFSQCRAALALLKGLRKGRKT